MAYFENYEFAQGIYRTLQELRSLKTSATILEFDAIAGTCSYAASVALSGRSVIR